MFNRKKTSIEISLMESFSIGLERVKARLDVLEHGQKIEVKTERPVSGALDIFLDTIIEVRGRKRIENMEIVIPEWLITVIRSENPLVQRNPEENEFYRGNMILNYRGVWIKGVKNEANDTGSPVTISKKEVFAGWDEAMGFERD